MAKNYTAQDMRDFAAVISRLHIVDRMTCGEYCASIKDKIRSMLRQAADLMEREEKREKKYEYAIKWPDGYICQPSDDISRQTEFLMFDRTRSVIKKLIRREVGEWEEVRDGE